jgi:hypothetical protein
MVAMQAEPQQCYTGRDCGHQDFLRLSDEFQCLSSQFLGSGLRLARERPIPEVLAEQVSRESASMVD